LAAPFSFWTWLVGWQRHWPLATNYYQRVRALAAPAHQGPVDQLWQWLQRRREMGREYRLHRLARLWVTFHTVMAWLLLVLVADHIVASFRYGGY
jgi:hypothetical protein